MQNTTIWLLIIAVPLALGLYWSFKPKLLQMRRARVRKRPVPDGLVEVLSRNVNLYRYLPPELREELLRHVNVFLDEKQFIGCDGVEITPEIRFTVAGSACMLLLNRKPSYFPGFTSILIYPETYETTQVSHEHGLEVHQRSRRAGESWHRGPIVLSWGDVLRGASNASDGYNVVLHEFAHKLDEENSGTNGQPILEELGHYREWSEVLGREYSSLEDRVARRKNSVIDEYGLTSPAEFFAVATESFFEKSASMQRKLPELYAQLSRFYALDPASWPR